MEERHYSPEEEQLIVANWADGLAKNDPELAEELVRDIIAMEQGE